MKCATHKFHAWLVGANAPLSCPYKKVLKQLSRKTDAQWTRSADSAPFRAEARSAIARQRSDLGSEELIWRHQTVSNYENTRNRVFDIRLRETCRIHSFCSSEATEMAGTESESSFNSTLGNCDGRLILQRDPEKIKIKGRAAIHFYEWVLQAEAPSPVLLFEFKPIQSLLYESLSVKSASPSPNGGEHFVNIHLQKEIMQACEIFVNLKTTCKILRKT